MKVELTYYFDNNNTKSYKGRLLGLIDEKQFAYLNNNTKTVADKIRTSRSSKLSNIDTTNYKNMRIVISIVSDKNSTGLFVSRPLDSIHSRELENDKVNLISFMDNDDNWLLLEKD